MRQVDSEALEELIETLRKTNTCEQPDRRRNEPRYEALSEDDADHLASSCTHRPQRCELACALCDRDRQRVRNHESADKERDETKGKQEILKE